MCFELQKLFFFPEGLFFLFFFQCEDPVEISSDVTAGRCEETVAVQRGLWQDGPEDKRRHLRASYLTTSPERLSGTPLRKNILAKTTKDETTHFKGKSLLAKMLRS